MRAVYVYEIGPWSFVSDIPRIVKTPEEQDNDEFVKWIKNFFNINAETKPSVYDGETISNLRRVLYSHFV
ncbi:hypothetical protein BpHYR1_022743 [Brachionus plicatilis]|uniref:Uncharacterized protein n=1 Tax=Brachionus plicatilis TaxID=10195 RepID=A0A3M7PGR4_BRAPC|nr:hypothetical protein BpHYR1_022743 [Brachionus plicatilis]